MFCPKSGRELYATKIDGETLPCCDFTECKNWGKLCKGWKEDIQKAGGCGGDCDGDCGDDCEC